MALIRGDEYSMLNQGEKSMPTKKILMLVGDFVEDYEVMVPFQMLLMVGHQVISKAIKHTRKSGATIFDSRPASMIPPKLPTMPW